MKRTKLFIQLLSLLVVWQISVFAVKQDKFFTRNGYIKFYSSTPVEDIEAENFKVTSVLDLTTSRVEFAVLIKAFEFEKALMEEHFNENYLESSKFPKATFKGTLIGIDNTGTERNNEQKVTAEGDLTIHGVTKHVSIPGYIIIGEDKIELKSEFDVSPEDYGIRIPNTVRENIAKSIKVTVAMNLNPL